MNYIWYSVFHDISSMINWIFTDKCAWQYGTTYIVANGAMANMKSGNRDFLIQQNWIIFTDNYQCCVTEYSKHSYIIYLGAVKHKWVREYDYICEWNSFLIIRWIIDLLNKLLNLQDVFIIHNIAS